MTTTLDTSCSENTIGFVSKARVSACMYFLVIWMKDYYTREYYEDYYTDGGQ